MKVGKETRLILHTGNCFNNKWVYAKGMYWAVNSVSDGKATLCMTDKPGVSCPSAALEQHVHRTSNTDKYSRIHLYNNGKIRGQIHWAGNGRADFGICEVISNDGGSSGEGVVPQNIEGKAVIAFTGVDKGPVYNINTDIQTYLDVTNMGGSDDIHVKYGIGYLNGSEINFTGVVASDSMLIKKYGSFKFVGTIPVRLTDYNARNMTTTGPSMIFIAGHKAADENIVWDNVKYTPIQLNLKSGYIDPLDPDGDGVPGGEPPGGWSDPWDEPGTGSGWPDPEKYPGGVADPDWIEKQDGDDLYDLMHDLIPLVYIGFAGLIGYLLIRSYR